MDEFDQEQLFELLEKIEKSTINYTVELSCWNDEWYCLVRESGGGSKGALICDLLPFEILLDYIKD
jgi:hypothetical protein